MSENRKRGRVKGKRISVQRPNVISALVDRLGLPDTILTYQDVADILSDRTGLRVTRAVIWRYLNKGQIPESRFLRQALGIPVTIPVAVCPLHGVVHERRCPGASPKPRKLSKAARRKRLLHDERWRIVFARMIKSRTNLK